MPRSNAILRTRAVASCLALAFLQSACMSPVAKLNRGDGNWRSAEFVRIVSDRAIDLPLALDCRKEVAGNNTFALTRQRVYESRFVHPSRYWIVPTEGREQLKEGDVVYFNIKDCRMPLVSEKL